MPRCLCLYDPAIRLSSLELFGTLRRPFLGSSFAALGMAGDAGRGDSLLAVVGGVAPPAFAASFALHPPPLFAKAPGLNFGAALGLSARGGIEGLLAGAGRLQASGPLVGRRGGQVLKCVPMLHGPSLLREL